MTYAEFYQKNSDMMHDEHMLKLSHSSALNMLEDEYRAIRLREEQAYRDRIRQENENYRREMEEKQQARRDLRHQYAMEHDWNEFKERMAADVANAGRV